jgi:hypothetical protein
MKEYSKGLFMRLVTYFIFFIFLGSCCVSCSSRPNEFVIPANMPREEKIVVIDGAIKQLKQDQLTYQLRAKTAQREAERFLFISFIDYKGALQDATVYEQRAAALGVQIRELEQMRKELSR